MFRYGVRHLHPTNHHPARIRKTDKDIAKERNFKDMKFLVKTRDIHKIERKRNLWLLAFLVTKKKKYPSYVCE